MWWKMSNGAGGRWDMIYRWRLANDKSSRENDFAGTVYSANMQVRMCCSEFMWRILVGSTQDKYRERDIESKIHQLTGPTVLWTRCELYYPFTGLLRPPVLLPVGICNVDDFWVVVCVITNAEFYEGCSSRFGRFCLEVGKEVLYDIREWALRRDAG